jgi:hypothetical protein
MVEGEISYIPKNFIEVEQLTIKSENEKHHTVIEHPEHGTLKVL